MRTAWLAAVAACGVLAAGSANATVTFTFSGTVDRLVTEWKYGAALASAVNVSLPASWSATLTFDDQHVGNAFFLSSYSVDFGALHASGTSSDPNFGFGGVTPGGHTTSFDFETGIGAFAPAVPGNEELDFFLTVTRPTESATVPTDPADYLSIPVQTSISINGALDSFAGYSSNSPLTSASISGAFPPGIPEPATWALMITGFMGIGLGLRRRRLEVAL